MPQDGLAIPATFVGSMTLTGADGADHGVDIRPTVGGWQPIETAPKTGDDLDARAFLAWCPYEQRDIDTGAPLGECRVVWWEPYQNGGEWYGDRGLTEKPILWMPLPPPPTE